MQCTLGGSLKDKAYAYYGLLLFVSEPLKWRAARRATLRLCLVHWMKPENRGVTGKRAGSCRFKQVFLISA